MEPPACYELTAAAASPLEVACKEIPTPAGQPGAGASLSSVRRVVGAPAAMIQRKESTKASGVAPARALVHGAKWVLV